MKSAPLWPTSLSLLRVFCPLNKTSHAVDWITVWVPTTQRKPAESRQKRPLTVWVSPTVTWPAGLVGPPQQEVRCSMWTDTFWCKFPSFPFKLPRWRHLNRSSRGTFGIEFPSCVGRALDAVALWRNHVTLAFFKWDAHALVTLPLLVWLRKPGGGGVVMWV